MRNVTFDRFGEPSEVLQISEVPITNPEPGQIRIKLVKRPVHPADLMMVRGLYGVKPPLPSIPGAEALAIIDALGAGVAGFEPGQRVVSLGAQGRWSDYIIVHPTSLIPIPDSIPDGVACQMFLNPLTANLLLDSVAAKRGDWLIQTAANSTVGRIVVQLAKRRGINLTNLVRAIPILGVRTVAQLKDLLGVLLVSLDDRQRWRLDAVSVVSPRFPHELLASERFRTMRRGGADIVGPDQLAP